MNNVAYIYSHDGDEHGIKFDVQLCTEDTLRATVRKHLDPDEDDPEYFAKLWADLSESGAYDFEDGWVVIKRGQEIVDFLIYQLREAKAEERYEGEQRFKEPQARQAAEAKYTQLREALAVALGPNAAEIAKAAA